MATTTPNYGWAVPTSTDLVKDGATAIETLGDAIDASMNTALGTKKAGMVLLNTTSFSAVASQSIDNVFTATYANYFINFEMTQNTSNANIGFRFRVGGADNSTSNYLYAFTGINTAVAADNIIGSGQTQSLFTRGFTTGLVAANMNFFGPQLSKTKAITSNSWGTSATGQGAHFTGAALFNASTVFDGITFITSAGTMTGTIRVYGYNN
jgi:hypothetical protein